MRKKPINIPDLFTRENDVCFGLIEVYPTEADPKDLTSDTSFEKYVPAMRVVCYYSPNMYKTLREIVRMSYTGSTAKKIGGLANEIVEKVEQSYSSYKELQL